MKTDWTNFSKKSPQERIQYLTATKLLSPENSSSISKNKGLSLEIANQMSENVLATFSLPYSLVPDILVNGKNYHVPFVTEEPSVVAAANLAAKIIKRSGGFRTYIHERKMIGQIALYNIVDTPTAIEHILKEKQTLIEIANQAHPSIVKRGGGARDLYLKNLTDTVNFLVVYLIVDTQEAMGANILNTMLEALISPLEDISGGKSLMAILSNYATESLVTATCSIDLRFLSHNRKESKKLGEKIVLASQFAQADPYRASTHNKGILNGIDAVVLATGNDWRAIEAGAHTYASRNGKYQGLSKWKMDKIGKQLLGQLTLPMPIASKGGSIGLNPTVHVSFDLLGDPPARELASIIVSVGLAQNFSALKALVNTGIQSGHMKLQAKSLALLAGSKNDEVPLVVQQLTKEKKFDLDFAKEILYQIRNKNNN